VAAFFEKQHRNVLRDIDVLADQAPSAALNFELSNYVDPTGRTLRCFDMTRDGSMLLAVGFTGARACEHPCEDPQNPQKRAVIRQWIIDE